MSFDQQSSTLPDHVDPFAGIGEPGGAEGTSLGGFDYEPSTGVEGSPDPTVVLEGHLDGTDDVDDEAQIAQDAELDAEFERVMAGEQEAVAEAQAVAAPRPEDPAPVTMADRIAAEHEAAQEAAPAQAPAQRTRGRRGGATQTQRRGATERSYTVLTNGELENGQPFWYACAEVKAPTARQAVKKAFALDFPLAAAGDVRDYWVVAAEQWHPHHAGFEEKTIEVKTRLLRRVVVS